MDMNPEIMCRLDGPEVAKFRNAYIQNRICGCFSIMEYNPHGNPFDTALIIDDEGDLKLYYRKMHPFVLVEPWEPGDVGIPVCVGPNGSKVALIICHDGMFPEMARESAYKGANIILNGRLHRADLPIGAIHESGAIVFSSPGAVAVEDGGRVIAEAADLRLAVRTLGLRQFPC